jgi:hypothetical protein
MRCIECKRSFKPSRSDTKICSNKCRQARDRRLHRKPRWRASASECDFDPEHDRVFPDTTDREVRGDAASYQMREAKRLVAEYALLRPGTQPHEITATRLRVIRSVIAASTRL